MSRRSTWPAVAVVVFPMAVAGLIIGGSFIAGFVLGIVGGIPGMIGPVQRGTVNVTEVSVCPNCGRENPRRNRYCGACGRPLRDETLTY